MAGWSSLRELVAEEFVQSIEEGKPRAAVEALRPTWHAAGEDETALRAVQRQLQALPITPDYPFAEPSELDAIRVRRPSAPRQLHCSLSDTQLYDRLYGAWLGRCCGCALGKPVEGFMGPRHGLSSRDRIKTYLTALGPDEYPLRHYFPQHSPASAQTGACGCPASTREHIAFMETDDDLRYTVLGQIILRERGLGFTSDDVARAWLDHLPFHLLCTAEMQAYASLVQRYGHLRRPHTIDWNWVATHDNPYREWIGADIRVDSWGYAAPGQTQLAAELAWRDARISHVKNGIYGAMFVAAMIAAAFALEEPRAVIEAGLAEIPSTCRLTSEMRQVIAICDGHQRDFARFEAVFDEIYQLLGHYHPVHTNNNAALVVAALLLGQRDFERTITLAVMGGWDTDCNGATAGSILGAMLGAERLPEKWTAPLHDTLYAQIVGYHPIAISECARRSLEIVQQTR